MANIYGIDPGSNNMGITILQVNLKTLKIVKIITSNLRPKKMNEDLVKGLIKTREALYEMFELYPPYKVIIEEPFMGRFIQSYKVLVTILTALELAVLDYNPNLTLEKIPVLTIKGKIGIKNTKDKNSTTERMSNLSPYDEYLKNHKHSVTQDIIDSMSIAHYGYLSYIEPLKK